MLSTRNVFDDDYYKHIVEGNDPNVKLEMYQYIDEIKPNKNKRNYANVLI